MTYTIDDTAWFLPLSADSERRVFGFPHAGAGCAQLVPLARELAGHGLALWSANLPGRQARLAERPRTDLAELAGELADALADLLDGRPYGLFGYCGGALAAFEVTRILADRQLPLPRWLFIASFEAPDIARRPYRLPTMPSSALWSHLAEEGGVSGEVATDERLRRLAEPAVRGDFTWLGHYRYQPGPALPVRIVVLHGRHDTTTPRGALLGWRRHSTFPVQLRPFDAGHWLLEDTCPGVAQAIAEGFPADERSSR
ncbi:thioesterase II family protein [Streptomyces sp. NPDC007856]|uniref:thioesterase II family protein n=1 Tax=Streptomyces sp. NPDC007856 TaxID=3364781 RepID=UPI0036751C41